MSSTARNRMSKARMERYKDVAPENPSKKPRLLMYNELPEWRKDNSFLLSGYRPTLNSYRESIQSIWAYWHNETGNIWSHLIGSSVAGGTALGLWIRYHQLEGFSAPFPHSSRPSVAWMDVIGYMVFYFSAVICLGFSTTFHTMVAHSQPVAKQCNKLDYIGIVVLISGSVAPLLRYGFYCHETLLRIYSTCHLGLAACTLWIVLTPHSHTPEYRRIRTWSFIGLGVSSVVPILHVALMVGLEQCRHTFGLDWMIWAGGLYIAGALIYAERVPERFWPGKLDLFGTSHLIFHIMILMAAYCTHRALVNSFEYRHLLLNGECSALD